MVGGLVIGFVVGVVLGVLLTLAAVRARRPAEQAATASVTPEPALGEPMPAPDDEVRQALDATAGLLDDLETRYRGRKAPPGEGEDRPRRRRTKT